MKHRIVLLSFFLSFAVASYAEDTAAERGKIAFTAHCARCHGSEGKGDGMDAKHLVVVPRDLTSGKFKFKSTVWGSPPTDEDIITGILGHGLAGSGMPSFNNLQKTTRADIVAYVKTISPAFQGGQAPQPVPRPANEHSKADLSKGKEIYNKLQCGSCHGPNGHANGTSAFTLKDSWERPIRPANLTQGWTYRGGNKPNDIYNRIVAGIEGAPMPSYEGTASHEEIWTLANYVASLQLKTNWSYDVVAVEATGALPSAGNDPMWGKAPRTDVNMQDYIYAEGHRQHLTVNAVSVQAIYNNGNVSLRLTWEDPVMDVTGTPDALVVAFKPTTYAGDTRGNLHNLYQSTDPALDLTLWQAQNDHADWNLGNMAALRDWKSTTKVASNASYEDGHWTLVLVRPLNLNPDDKFELTSTHALAFVAWDGHNDETGVKRSSSEWLRLHIGQKAAHGE